MFELAPPTLAWWAANALDSGPVYLASWVFWVIASITLHELGHGWAAIACGDNTPRELGHMTLNPIVHMGGMSLLIFAVAGIAWGQMPVNPNRFRGRLDEAFVSFAGPAVNAALALLCAIGLALFVRFDGFGAGDTFRENTTLFLLLGGMLNIVLFMLNLLPIPPLDGSRIIGNFSRGFREWAFSPSGMMVGMLLFIPVFFLGGRVLFPAAAKAFRFTVDLLLKAIGG